MKRVHNNRIMQWRKQNHLYIAPGTDVHPLPPREMEPVPTNASVAARARQQAAGEWGRSPLFGLSNPEKKLSLPEEDAQLSQTPRNDIRFMVANYGPWLLSQ